MKTSDPVYAVISAIDAIRSGEEDFTVKIGKSFVFAVRKLPEEGPIRDRYPFQWLHFVWRYSVPPKDKEPHFTLDRMIKSMDALWVSSDGRKTPLAGRRFRLHFDSSIDGCIPEASHMKRVGGELIASVLISDRNDPNTFGVL